MMDDRKKKRVPRSGSDEWARWRENRLPGESYENFMNRTAKPSVGEEVIKIELDLGGDGEGVEEDG